MKPKVRVSPEGRQRVSPSEAFQAMADALGPKGRAALDGMAADIERARHEETDLAALRARHAEAVRLLSEASRWMRMERRRMPIEEIDAFLAGEPTP